MALPGATVDTIRTVHSHVHALGQCRKVIRELGPDAGRLRRHRRRGPRGRRARRPDPGRDRPDRSPRRSTGSTSCARTSRTRTTTPPGSWCSPATTSRRRPATARSSRSFVFHVRNLPAALYKALGGFATNGVNMTKLESYMVDGQFTATQFLAEVDGHPSDPGLARALEELEFFTHDVKVLGVYPAAPETAPPLMDPRGRRADLRRDLRRRAARQDVHRHARARRRSSGRCWCGSGSGSRSRCRPRSPSRSATRRRSCPPDAVARPGAADVPRGRGDPVPARAAATRSTPATSTPRRPRDASPGSGRRRQLPGAVRRRVGRPVAAADADPGGPLRGPGQRLRRRARRAAGGQRPGGADRPRAAPRRTAAHAALRRRGRSACCSPASPATSCSPAERR